MDDAGVMVVVGAPKGHVVSGVVDVALAATPNPPQIECSRRPDHDGMRRRLFLVNDARLWRQAKRDPEPRVVRHRPQVQSIHRDGSPTANRWRSNTHYTAKIIYEHSL
jgi:hypothetical protein